MDFLQLVFGFVNAPLFATFLLGMFWKRTTGHGAFGLISGTVAAVHHGLTLPEAPAGIHGGWITVVHTTRATWRRTSGRESGRSACVGSDRRDQPDHSPTG